MLTPSKIAYKRMVMMIRPDMADTLRVLETHMGIITPLNFFK